MIDKKRQQNGLSLIEVLIAIAIGIILLLGAVTLFINNKRVYKELNNISRLDETARFAMEILKDDIRMAGYSGCVNRISDLKNNLTNVGDPKLLHNYTFPIEGLNDKDNTTKWVPSDSNEEVAAITNATDAITLRYLDPLPRNQVKLANGMASANANILLSCPSNCTNVLTDSENLAITDCEGGDIFRIGPVLPGAVDPSTTLRRAYTNINTTALSRYKTTRYYIRQSANNNAQGNPIPSLFRYTSVEGVPTRQELLEGVENMQIMYGVDTDGDNAPDNYSEADGVGVANWGNVVSVKLMLLLRTIDENFHIDPDENTYTLFDEAEYNDVNDLRHRRRVFTTTVQIRNQRS